MNRRYEPLALLQNFCSRFRRHVTGLLAVLAVLLCPPPEALGQLSTPCLPLQCPTVEICPVPASGGSANFSCDPVANPPYLCDSPDDCIQAQFIVRLKAPAGLPQHFDLQYEELSVALKFEIVTASGVPRSYIDLKETQSCNDPLWVAADALTVEDGNTVTFRLENSFANDQCENATDPIAFFSGIATLFTVYVNVYPGETVRLACEELLYQSGGEENFYCSDDGTTASTLFGCNGPAEISEGTPGFSPATSGNQALLVNLDNASTGDLPCEVEVKLTNNDQVNSLDIESLDFTVVIELDQIMEDIEFIPVSISDYAPVGSGGGIEILEDGNKRYVHVHIKDNFTIAANSTIVLFKIKVDKPVMKSQKGSVTYSLDAANGRVHTNLGCSKLLLSTMEEVCEFGEFDLCNTPASDLYFEIFPAPTNNTCGTQQVYVGLYSNSSAPAVELYHLAFELDFTYSPGVSIDPNLDLSGWGDCPSNNGGCNGIGACPGTEVNGATASLCWSVDPAYPHTITPGNFVRIDFPYTGVGCIQDVRVRRMEVGMIDPQSQQALPICIAEIEALNFPVCPATSLQISGTIETELGKCVPEALVTCAEIENSPTLFSKTDQTACPADPQYLVCVDPQFEKYRVSAFKDNDPLNGVSTFDLLLMNKHILGVTPLGSPYLMIAADANNSNTITTVDIVELRRLILGIYTEFGEIPQYYNQTSWRFIDKSFVFPNPLDPFASGFPEYINLDFSSSPLPAPDFIGVKIGDVNGNVNPFSGERPLAEIAWSSPAARAGEYLTVPVWYAGAGTLEAIQLGLRFDPARLSLLGPSQGDVPGWNAGNFGLRRAAQGEIRTLWYVDPQDPFQAPLKAGDVLFYLTFRVLQDLPESGLPLQIEDSVLPSLAWSVDLTEHRVQAAGSADRETPNPTPSSADLTVSCFPNPSSAGVIFSITTDKAQRVRLALFGPFGGRVWYREVELTAGEQQITAGEAAALPAGVYVWKAYAGDAKIQGHFIKQ